MHHLFDAAHLSLLSRLPCKMAAPSSLVRDTLRASLKPKEHRWERRREKSISPAFQCSQERRGTCSIFFVDHHDGLLTTITPSFYFLILYTSSDLLPCLADTRGCLLHRRSLSSPSRLPFLNLHE